MPISRASSRSTLRLPAFWLGLICLAAHLIFNRGYGIFRDELYFIVCGEHFAFGYVDQPPLIPWIAAASHALFGVALTPLRLAPALAMSATVALTAQYARLIGGSRYAQTLAGLSVLLAPIYLAQGLLLTTDFLQALAWLGCLWALTRVARGGDERWWVAFGVIAGVGMASKYSTALYLIALAIGAVLTPLRRSLAKPWIYVGAALTLALAAPHLIWQAAHGWPFLEIASAGAGGKNVELSPLGFFLGQVMQVGPLAAPLWIAGLWRLANDPRLRAIAIAYFVLFAFFVAAHGKLYYLAPLYPALIAAGGVAFEAWIARPVLRGVAAGAIVVLGLMTAPLALPVLAPEAFVRYTRALHFAPAPMEHSAQSVLPQYFADMFGWPELAAEVARVYQELPETERADAVFFGRNYGEAAAVEILGPQFGAPPAISGHNNYFLWGSRGFSGSVVIMIGAGPPSLASNYGEIQVAGHLSTPYAMPSETDVSVYVLRRPAKPLSEIWPSLRHYD